MCASIIRSHSPQLMQRHCMPNAMTAKRVCLEAMAHVRIVPQDITQHYRAHQAAQLVQQAITHHHLVQARVPYVLQATSLRRGQPRAMSSMILIFGGVLQEQPSPILSPFLQLPTTARRAHLLGCTLTELMIICNSPTGVGVVRLRSKCLSITKHSILGVAFLNFQMVSLQTMFF